MEDIILLVLLIKPWEKELIFDSKVSAEESFSFKINF